MRLRLIFLLLVATVSGTVAGLAENARAGKATCRAPGAGATSDRHPAVLLPSPERPSRRVPSRSSAAGAHGLLQVLPSTAAQFELDTSHVGESVLAGARYLRQLLDRFESTELALAAYIAGRPRSKASARDERRDRGLRRESDDTVA